MLKLNQLRSLAFFMAMTSITTAAEILSDPTPVSEAKKNLPFSELLERAYIDTTARSTIFVNITRDYYTKQQLDSIDVKRLFPKISTSLSSESLRVLSILLPAHKISSTFVDELVKRASQEDPIAQITLGGMFESGHGVDKDTTKAIDYYKSAADQNNPIGLNCLAVISYRRGALREYNAPAMKNLQMAADLKDPVAQNNLGYCYLMAVGVELNYKKARELFELSAEQGYPYAIINLSDMYRCGLRVPKDLKKAFDLIHAAAEQGDSTAQNRLGYMYQEGIGVPKDFDKGLESFQAAFKQGYPVAPDNLETKEQRASKDKRGLFART